MLSITIKIIFYMCFILSRIYCGFVQDAFITISLGVITSFSNNRNDPRIMVKNTTAGTNYALAINYNSIWIVKNISNTTYFVLAERNYHQNTFL